jgi:hypothetical protein
MGWSQVQGSRTECGVSEGDREAWIMRRPWPTRGCCATEKKKLFAKYRSASCVFSLDKSILDDIIMCISEIFVLLGCYVAKIGSKLQYATVQPIGITFKVQARQTPWTAWPLKMGLVCCTETSVTNNQFTLCKIPEERQSHLHREGSLKSRISH